MSTIIISIDDDTERRFRETGKKKLGQLKGCVGKTTTEAMETRLRKQAQDEIANDALALPASGFDPGKKQYQK